MERKFIVAAIVVIVIIVAAVGAVYFYKPAPPSPEKLKVGALYVTTINDGSYCFMGYKALMEIAEEYDADVSYHEWVAFADQEAIMRSYVAEGYDIIIGHGFEFGDTLWKVAKDYPDVSFVWSGGSPPTEEKPLLNNTFTILTVFWEGSYLTGMIAAGVTETNKIGFISGFAMPTVIANYNAYVMGAKKINPDVEVLYTITGSFADLPKAKEAAFGQIGTGADVVVGLGDGLCLGTIEAARESGVYAIGYLGDMNVLASGTVVTSILYDLYPVYAEIVDLVVEGTFGGEEYSWGMDKGVVDIAPYHGLEDEIPQSVKDAVETDKQAIMNGTLVIPFDTTPP